MITSPNPVFTRALAILALALMCSATVNAKPAVPQQFYNAWTDQFVPTQQDPYQVTGVALDSRGNVIETGFGIDGSTEFFYTAKYDALDGALIWSQTYMDPDGSAFANSVAVDSQDNIYVGGGAIIGSDEEDFYLIKYNSAGTQIWAKSYNGTAGGQDEIRKVIYVPDTNEIVVTGISEGSVSDHLDFETIAYNTSGGVVWSDRLNYYNAGDDTPAGLACDSSGNIFVCGAATDSDDDEHFLTVRYTSAGTQSWAEQFEAPTPFYGATSVVADSTGDAIVTGHYNDASGNDGFYTLKYQGPKITFPITIDGGTVLWSKLYQQLVPQEAATTLEGATSIAVDGNNNVLVTGALYNDPNDSLYVVKYFSDGGQDWAIEDSGTAGGPSHAVQVVSDGGGNAVVIGDAYNGDDQDIYIAKYSQADGHKIWSTSYAGNAGFDDVGIAVTTDANGDVIAAGDPKQLFNGTSDGEYEFVVLKYDRLLLETNDPLPDTTGLAANPTIFSLDAPALSDSGGIADLITANSGKAKLTAILTEDNGGGISLPAVQKQPAVGLSKGTYSRFSDPVVAPNGAYGFAATVAGGAAKEDSGFWDNLSGNLEPVLIQGVTVPGAVENTALESVNSVSMRDAAVLALVKVEGKDSISLLSVDEFGGITGVAQTDEPILIDGTDTTIKSITTLSPTVLSPGDGRWQGDGTSVIKVTTADKDTAICAVTSGGAITPILYNGLNAAGIVGITGAKWESFGLPAIGPIGEEYTVMGTLEPIKGSITTANNTALIYSQTGSTFLNASSPAYIQKGGTPTDGSLSGLKYGDLTDPIINGDGYDGAIVSLTGKGVSAKNDKAVMWGTYFLGMTKIARLGDFATDSTGFEDSTDDAVYSDFISFALPSGVNLAPIFVAKLSGHGVTAKNDMGIWAYSTDGQLLRRLLRTGDVLGTRTVASFTVLKAPSKDFAAARNFNATATVTILVTFTDHTQGVVAIGIP